MWIHSNQNHRPKFLNYLLMILRLYDQPHQVVLTHQPHQLSAKSLLPQNPHLPKGKVLAHGCKVWTHKISPICHGLRQRDHHHLRQHPDQDLRKKINNLIDIDDHLVMIIIEDVIMIEDITTE